MTFSHFTSSLFIPECYSYLFSLTGLLVFFAKRLLANNCFQNVDEIDARAQFHKHSTYSFDTRGAQMQIKDSQVVNLFTLFGFACAKAVRKMLMKLRPEFVVMTRWICGLHYPSCHIRLTHSFTALRCFSKYLPWLSQVATCRLSMRKKACSFKGSQWWFS